MASFDEQRETSRGTAVACVVILLAIVLFVVVAAHSAGERLNPDTGCGYEEVLTSEGVCR